VLLQGTDSQKQDLIAYLENTFSITSIDIIEDNVNEKIFSFSIEH